MHEYKEGPLELPWGAQRAGGPLIGKGCGERYSEGAVLGEARVPGLIITVAQIRPPPAGSRVSVTEAFV